MVTTNRKFIVPVILICVGLAACSLPIPFGPPDEASSQEVTTTAVPQDQPDTLEVAADAPTPTPEPTLPPQPVEMVVTLKQPYGPLEMEMLAKINKWRLEIGLWPFKPNTLLDELALRQAQYLVTIPDGPTDYHADASGKYPVERGFEAGWPAYNNPGQTAIGEVAYEGTVDDAIDYWHNSPIHNKTVTEPGFREIGVAAVPYRYGSLFIVLVGGRPDTLPALVDPTGSQLYLTTERYRWREGDRIQEAVQVQVLPSAESPIDPAAWQPWSATVSLPTTLGETFAIAYSDGSHVVIDPVEVATDIAWLPDNLASATLTLTIPLIGSVEIASVDPQPTEAPAALPTEAPITPGPWRWPADWRHTGYHADLRAVFAVDLEQPTGRPG